MNNINFVLNGEALDQSILNRPVRELIQKLGTLAVKNNITGDDITPGSITSINLTLGTITGDYLQTNTVDSKNIQPQSILTDKVKDKAVNTVKLQDRAVTAVKLAPGAVNSTHMQNNSVTNQQLQGGSVTLQKIQSIPGSAILGNSNTGTGQVSSLSPQQVRSAVGLGDVQTLNVGIDIGEVLTSGQLGLGTYATKDVSVIMYEEETSLQDWLQQFDPDSPEYDAGQTVPEFNQTFGDITKLPQGLYAIGANHSQAPIQAEGTLTVNMHQGSLGTFIFSTARGLFTPPRIFIQNTHGSGSGMNWVELITADSLEVKIQEMLQPIRSKLDQM